MKRIQNVLADLIRRGQVTVDIPGLDADQLEHYFQDYYRQVLVRVTTIVFDNDMSDKEKISWLKENLAF